MEHTKEPWGPGVEIFMSAKAGEKFGPAFIYPHGHSQELCEANARRIVACVNMCAGLSTEAMEEITKNEELLKDRVRFLRTGSMRADELQYQLETERASLFAESQRKQQLEQQVAELVQALEFYADKQRYMGSNQRVEAPDIYGESPSNTVYLWDVMKDGGDIARAVIQKVRGGE